MSAYIVSYDNTSSEILNTFNRVLEFCNEIAERGIRSAEVQRFEDFQNKFGQRVNRLEGRMRVERKEIDGVAIMSTVAKFCFTSNTWK